MIPATEFGNPFKEEYVMVDAVQYFVVGDGPPAFLHPTVFETSHIQGCAAICPNLIFFEIVQPVAVPKRILDLVDG